VVSERNASLHLCLRGQRSKAIPIGGNQSPKLAVKHILVFVCHLRPNADPKIKWVIRKAKNAIIRKK